MLSMTFLDYSMARIMLSKTSSTAHLDVCNIETSTIDINEKIT